MLNALEEILVDFLTWLGGYRPPVVDKRTCVTEGDMYCNHPNKCAIDELEDAHRAKPEPEFERVHCDCPPYRGSDFWNDPHRWCDRDPAVDYIWRDKPRSCERTVRLKPAYLKAVTNMRYGVSGKGAFFAHRPLNMVGHPYR